MDPNACVDRILSALRHGDLDETRDASDDLVGWLARGGFAPRPTAYSELAAASSDTFLTELDALMSRIRPEDTDDL